MTEKYGGNTPCVSLRHADTFVIIDGGTGIRNLGVEIANEYEGKFERLDLHLFLSHTHWDHIQGIPFFEPAYIENVNLTIYGSTSKKGFLENVLRGQMDYDYFPIDMSAMNCDLTIREIQTGSVEVGPYKIDWEEQHYHPGGCLRYRIDDGEKRLIYASDVELNACFNNPDPTDLTKRHCQEYLNFVQGVDMLIADGQYTDEEYPDKVGWGHTTIPLIVDIAYQSRVKQLALFHHDPAHSDRYLDTMAREYQPEYMSKQPPMNVFWAREGFTVAL